MTKVMASSASTSNGLRSFLTMEDLIADVTAPLLDVEEALIQQRGLKEVCFSKNSIISTNNILSGSLPRHGQVWSGHLLTSL